MNFQNAAKAGVEAGLNQIAKCIQSNFENRQGDFKPLVAATIKRRNFLGFSPAPILIASGTLQKHIADERSAITTNGHFTSGTISPSTSATPDYGDQPISEYAGALNKIREFWDVKDSGQIEEIGKAVIEAFTQRFNNG